MKISGLFAAALAAVNLLAAAIAAELAAGKTLADAVQGAKDYVHGAIANSYWVGEGCGVLGLPQHIPERG